MLDNPRWETAHLKISQESSEISKAVKIFINGLCSKDN